MPEERRRREPPIRLEKSRLIAEAVVRSWVEEKHLCPNEGQIEAQCLNPGQS